jgi:hypothetical protein
MCAAEALWEMCWENSNCGHILLGLVTSLRLKLGRWFAGVCVCVWGGGGGSG